MAQELLATFEEQLGGVTLVPNAEGGVFEVRLAGETIFSRKEAGRFPDIQELKQLVRDRIAPDRDLGHIDRASRPAEDALEEEELGEATPAVENGSRQRKSRRPRD